MGEFPNKATMFKSGPKQVKIASKGGKTVTQKQRVAGYLREKIKMYAAGAKLTSEEADEIYEFITNPELGIAQIQRNLQKAKPLLENSPKGQLGYNRLLVDLHKQAHGTKTKNENLNVNIDVINDKLTEKLNNIFAD